MSLLLATAAIGAGIGLADALAKNKDTSADIYNEKRLKELEGGLGLSLAERQNLYAQEQARSDQLVLASKESQNEALAGFDMGGGTALQQAALEREGAAKVQAQIAADVEGKNLAQAALDEQELGERQLAKGEREMEKRMAWLGVAEGAVGGAIQGHALQKTMPSTADIAAFASLRGISEADAGNQLQLFMDNPFLVELYAAQGGE
jgi:hypothetical protein